MVAHNAAFDREFVSHELYLLGLSLSTTWVCSMVYGQEILGYCPRLSDLFYEVCGTHRSGLHRAMGDVNALVRVTQQLWPYPEGIY